MKVKRTAIKSKNKNMETGKLLIQTEDDGSVKIIFEPVNGTVWLSSWEIGKLLGTYSVAISNHLRVIFKSGVLREDEVCHCQRYSDGRSVDLYNLEAVLALAFRIHSPNADLVRKWAMERVVGNKVEIEPLIILNPDMPLWMN
jgi:hypothetical protein